MTEHLFKAVHEKGLRKKAQTVHEALARGEMRYEHVKGKRLNFNRAIISVPIGERYRIVYREINGKLEFLRCLSHSDYNTWVKRQG